jgi:Thiol:disulfide interchange protein DsbD, N-terminal
VEGSDAFTVDKIEFPKPLEVDSDVFQKKLKLYQDKISIAVFLKLNSGISGEIPVNGTLQFQACSDKLCLPPSKQSFSGKQVVIE